ncbi:CobQ/CobB/MinD/ParA nucleotide binding domain-containing protein [Arthrobacter subterraneus]|uniref:CobQ/CobB/MinD/ParA nucleotide binding domain-containing protein n=2 Tax=Arthrobacter subterraneus TaxID=335973 RepID=A0A1G8MRI2_9MICC|nr:CobQ/CobB/MinD/ParA nucleotide binding domain-containing protein [Arthrobacter subterraneus]
MYESMLASMQTLMVYSESGGATKTTTAVSLAAVTAAQGREVVLIDLDPRAASSKWLDAQPKEDGLHVGAILGDPDPVGWAEELAVPTDWFPTLRCVPSARNVSNREADRADHAELRLKTSLEGIQADLVIIDCPNRQGGPLTLSALNAADTIVYAAAPTVDGADGVDGARRSVEQFKLSRRRIGAPDNLTEAGIVVGAVQETIMSRIAVTSIDELRDTGLLLTPLVPHRTIVQEMRLTHEWYGQYRKGAPVVAAYTQLAEQVIR